METSLLIIQCIFCTNPRLANINLYKAKDLENLLPHSKKVSPYDSWDGWMDNKKVDATLTPNAKELDLFSLA